MRRSSLTLVAVALLSVSGVAAAQEAPAAAPTKDKAAVTFNEVERGIYLGASAGPLFMPSPPLGAASPCATAPATVDKDGCFSVGQMAEVEVGFDIGDRLSIGAFLAGTSNHEDANYYGSSGGTASGDFAMLIPGGNIRVNVIGFADSQGTTRTFVYARAGGGYVFYGPAELLGNTHDVLVFAGGGVEYYTRLRHFSIGLEVSASALLPSGSLGFALTPSLRYAF